MVLNDREGLIKKSYLEGLTLLMFYNYDWFVGLYVWMDKWTWIIIFFVFSFFHEWITNKFVTSEIKSQDQIYVKHYTRMYEWLLIIHK